MCPENDDGLDQTPPEGDPSDDADEVSAEETPAEKDVESTPPAEQPAPPPPAEYDVDSTLPMGPPAEAPPDEPISTLPPTGYTPAPDEPISTLPPTGYQPAPPQPPAGQEPPVDPAMYTLPMTPPPPPAPPAGQPISTLPPTGYQPPQAPDGNFPSSSPPMGQHQPPPPTTKGFETSPHGGTPLPVASVFANRFEIISQLGEGGMGQVFKVKDRQIEGRVAALKVLHPKFSNNPQFRDLFFAEISANAGFVSEQVIQVRDTGHEEGRLFLTMDLVDGEDVSDLLDREGSLDARHALEITRQTLLGLGVGHEKGFVHRDIKPSNIMLAKGIAKTDENPHGVGVRLLDFGIAALADEMEDGQIAGTPMYMSPEQASGQRLDARSDLFSLGNCLFEMISGSRLFSGKTVADITTSVLNVQVGPRIEELEHLSPAIRKILDKALQKDRKKRFQSADEFIAAIEKSSAYRMPKGVPFWVGGLLVVSLLAAVGEGYVIFEQRLELLEGTGGVSVETLENLRTDLNGQIATLQTAATGYRDEIADKAGQIAKLESREDTESVADESTAADLEAANATIASQDTTIAGLNLTNDRLAGEKTDNLATIDDLKEQNLAMSDELAREQSKSNPAAKKGWRFDRIVSLVEKRQGNSARDNLQAIRVDDLLTEADIDGGAFIEQFVSASMHLYDYEQSDPENRDLGLLDKAKTAHAAALDGHAGFLVNAQEWLETAPELGAEIPPREANLDAALAVLGQQISSAETANEEMGLALVNLAKSFTADSDFDQVKEFADANPIGMLAGFFDQYAAAASASIERGNQLQRDELMDWGALDHWGTELGKQVDALDNPSTQAVRHLWDARRWYSGDDYGALEQRAIDPPSSLGSEPVYDWKLQLALQMAMTQLDSAKTPTAGFQNIYRDTILARNNELRWAVYDLDEAGDKFSVTRRFYDPSGDQISDPRSYDVGLEGQLFTTDSGELDLTELGDDIYVALWQPAAGDSAPAGPIWSQGLDTAAFASKLAASPVPCVVVKRGADESWYSPQHGLVKELKAGTLLRELVETTSR
jgi:serine/threonine-protein kinase